MNIGLEEKHNLTLLIGITISGMQVLISSVLTDDTNKIKKKKDTCGI